MKEYICGNSIYTLSGQTNKTIALSIEIDNLPEKVVVEGIELVRKTEFHVSLVCIGQYLRKHSIDDNSLVRTLVKEYCEFIKLNTVELLGYKSEYRFVEESDRKSLVVMCDITNLKEFFDLINQKYNLSFEYQPTHVSLFTLQLDKAIFLIDDKDINELSRTVPAPHGVTL